MPNERLVPQRQRRELVGVELDNGGVVDLLEDVLAAAFCRGRRGCRSGSLLAARVAGYGGCQEQSGRNQSVAHWRSRQYAESSRPQVSSKPPLPNACCLPP